MLSFCLFFILHKTLQHIGGLTHTHMLKPKKIPNKDTQIFETHVFDHVYIYTHKGTNVQHTEPTTTPTKDIVESQHDTHAHRRLHAQTEKIPNKDTQLVQRMFSTMSTSIPTKAQTFNTPNTSYNTHTDIVESPHDTQTPTHSHTAITNNTHTDTYRTHTDTQTPPTTTLRYANARADLRLHVHVVHTAQEEPPHNRRFQQSTSPTPHSQFRDLSQTGSHYPPMSEELSP